jgi:phage shock protein A
MPRHDFIDKFDDEDTFIQMEYEIKNLKEQIKQLKTFGETQVFLNSKQARQIRQLVNENEKLNEHIKILSC